MNTRSILIEKYIKPSETLTRDDGRFIERWLDKDYYLHSFMGQPSVISYENGKIKAHSWHKKDKLHRDKDLPSVEYYNFNEQTEKQYWFKNNVLHRDNDQPAIIFYDENVEIQSQDWYKNGEFVKSIDKTIDKIINLRPNKQGK